MRLLFLRSKAEHLEDDAPTGPDDVALFAFVCFFTNAGCPAEALLATVAAHQSRQWSIFVVSTKGVSGLAALLLRHPFHILQMLQQLISGSE